MKQIMQKFLTAAGATACVVLAGCQTMPDSWRADVRGRIDADMEQARTGKPTEVSQEVNAALLPPLEVVVPEGKMAPAESRFDLAVSGASARQVFLGLVEGTSYDVVVHPTVGGTVTLNLKGVTVPEAFDALREAYGYDYRRDGNRFFVLSREMQMRVFNVNYLNLVRKGKSDTRVTASGLSTTGSPAGGGMSNSTGTSTGQSGVQVETGSQSDFWKGLQAALVALVGTESGRRVIVNPETGIVIVRAMPDELRHVAEYLGATHAVVNRQVVLEAKIVEVELSDGFQTGINWSKLSNEYTFGQVGGGRIFDGTGASEIAGNAGDLNPGAFSAVNGTMTSAFGGVFTIAAKFDNFAAFVELLKSQGEVQVLSSPRVSTINNQKAVIKVGTDEFFVISQNFTPATTGGQPTITTELAPFFSGIALDVTPQIDESGNINMHIHPSVSNVATKNIPLTFDTSGGALTQLSTARSSVQESDNIVRARNGQVIVIGGLMKEGTTDDNASVPFLGDVPILGNLFKHKKVTRIKRELVILLKPTVIQLDQDWNDAVGETQERIKKIRIGS